MLIARARTGNGRAEFDVGTGQEQVVATCGDCDGVPLGAEIGNAGIKIGISHDRLIQKSSGCGGGYAETCRKH